MLLDVNLVLHDEANSCTEEAIATLAAWLKRDYELMYKDCWFFSYDKITSLEEPQSIGRQISIDISMSTNLDHLEYYHGIKLTQPRLTDTKDIINMIIGEIKQNRPVVLDINGYWCPWVASYKKVNIEHGVLVTGIDESNEAFLCTDSFYGKNCVLLPFDHFSEGYISCYTFLCKESFEIDFIAGDIAKDVAAIFERTNSIKALKDLCADIKEHFDFSKEIDGAGSYETSRFYILFDRYRRSRKKVANVLKYIGEKKNEPVFIDLSKEMITLFSKWDIIHKILLRAFLSGRFSGVKDIMAESLNKIIADEGNMVNKLQNII